MFRDVFYRKFNLRFKPPLQDTCDLCNKINTQLKSRIINPTFKIQLLEQKNEHHQRFENVNREYKEHVDNSKLSGGSKVVLVFDLQKVLDTPIEYKFRVLQT